LGGPVGEIRSDGGEMSLEYLLRFPDGRVVGPWDSKTAILLRAFEFDLTEGVDLKIETQPAF
jgi:hypothetical protein